MFKTLRKLKYGARVLLSRGGGTAETIDVAGRSTAIMSGGAGQTFVYLHSTLGETTMWLPFYQTWSKKFNVLVPTHPGFGHSAGFDEIDTIEDMAFHYVELFDALGLEQVVLGGVSLGGWIAAEFACRWPERVKKLWISGAPGVWVDEEPLPDIFRLMQDKDNVRQILFHDPNGPMASLVIPSNPDEAALMQVYQNMTVLARMVWQRPYDPKLAARLRRVQCPTLLIWGEDDRLVPVSYGREYAKHIPGSELKIIKDCGHVTMFEKEAEFVDTIQRFCLQG